ncbi:MAG: nucleotide sugar dehydrogenase [Peptococcaceae bacterium]|jgi:UDP-N-acetyl-D-mannosaminuronic acid dehydrogenase|nr:nucleotide sugar dehydrogenase [Peptococcaceae bacterium]MDH7524530.1 nucleotide sugar dehydrogenase [Peptococcaceae bacterium]
MYQGLKNIEISVVGLGYIGIPTATLFANAGFKVYGYDINKEIIESLNRGVIHIVEPDLEELFKKALFSGRLVPTGELVPADIYIICVPTPIDENKRADLSHVKKAVEMILPILKNGNIIILESTVPPGTTKWIERITRDKGFVPNRDIFIAHCPERVLPGKIVYEFENNDRIIGTDSIEAAHLLKAVYSKVVKNGSILITKPVVAELCKLVENTYRDVNIALANELSIICDELQVDVNELIELANRHPRVKILSPGTGVGGHCLAVDPWFIVEKAPGKSRLISTARKVNDSKPYWLARKIIHSIESELKGVKPVIGILGLSYKPDIDDLRESPSLKIARELLGKGFKVCVSEPHVRNKVIEGMVNLPVHELIEVSQYVVISVNHSAFRTGDVLKTIAKKKYFDCVGLMGREKDVSGNYQNDEKRAAGKD